MPSRSIASIQNELIASYDNERDAIEAANDLAKIEQISGLIEVHGFHEADAQLLNPRLVHRVRA